jgi:hypothetical protein
MKMSSRRVSRHWLFTAALLLTPLLDRTEVTPQTASTHPVQPAAKMQAHGGIRGAITVDDLPGTGPETLTMLADDGPGGQLEAAVGTLRAAWLKSIQYPSRASLASDEETDGREPAFARW